MKFETIYVAGFGCLKSVNLNLTSGLNVFFGPNEAGKSTLQQAFWALLYGFYRGDRKTPGETDQLLRFRPWSNGTYGGHLAYRLDNGRAYRVDRAFDEDDPRTTLTDADTGRDMTTEFDRGKHGRVAFAQQHFGMPEEVFVNTCFIRQAELHDLAKSAHAISETIVNLSGTGSQDRSVNRAKVALETTMREQIGTIRAQSKPWAQLQKRLEELNGQKQRVLEQRRALEADLDKRLELSAKKQELEEEVEALEYSLAIARRERLAERLAQIRDLRAQLQGAESRLAELGDAADFPANLRVGAARLHQEWLAGRDRLTEANREAEAAGPEIIRLTRQRQNFIEQQRPLESARNVPSGRESHLRRLEEAWREANQRHERIQNDLKAAAGAVAEALSVREQASAKRTLLQAGPQALHDVRLRWEAAARAVEVAAGDVSAAEDERNRQSLSAEQFEQLESRFLALNFDRLSALKDHAASVRNLKAQASSGLGRNAAWVVASAGGALTIAGALAGALGIVRANGALAAIGFGAAVAGLALAFTGAYVLRTRSKRERLVQEASTQLDGELAPYTIGAVEDLEKAFHSFLAAQPAHSQWIRARKSRDEKQNALGELEAEVRAMLEMPPDLPLDALILTTAEQEAHRLGEQFEELKKREQHHDELQAQTAEAHRGLSDIEAPLREGLKAAGLDSGDAGLDAQRYYELCANRRQLERLDAELRAVSAELEALKAGEQRSRTAKIALDNAENELRAALRRGKIDEADLELAFSQYEARAIQAEEARRLGDTFIALKNQIDALRRNQSLEELQREEAALAAEVQARLAANADRGGPTSDSPPEVIQARLNTAKKNLSAGTAQLAMTVGRIQQAMAGMRSLAEVEEEIRATQAEVDHLAFHGKALKLALEVLTEVADDYHRNFLPRLNGVVGNSLKRVTGGRYSQVQIDNNDLQVRVTVPERTESVTPNLLSRGAQEQIYLLLRLGLTELMSSGRERLPLMLDDPLVNYDRARLTHGLEFLSDLSAQTQVLLFTKDEATVEWFREHCANSEAHRLHSLTL
ncbi:MAG TPA: AAA family ATPase [Anaerolineales bacterium]|nr:AAA family ATPase [Anaerolineales bacterium]